MPNVLVASSVLQCAHQSPLTIVPSQTSLTVDKQPVLVENDVLNATFACPNVGPGLTPCTKVVAITAGVSNSLKVGGAPVVLETAMGTTNCAPTVPVGFKVTSAGQTKLQAS